MSDAPEWPHTYEGRKKTWRRSKQWYAMKARRAAALGHAKPDQTYDRVGVIVDLMRKGGWTSDRVPDLAAEWRVSESRVEQLAAEAARVVRRHG